MEPEKNEKAGQQRIGRDGWVKQTVESWSIEEKTVKGYVLTW